MKEHKLIAPHDKRRIYDRQNGLCAYCGQHRNMLENSMKIEKGGATV